MNRQERRKQEKNLKNNREIINSMTPAQAKIADLVATERANVIANDYIDKFSNALNVCMTATLIDYGVEYDDIESIQNDLSNLLEEHSKKIEKLEGDLNMSKLDLEVKQAVREILKNFTIKKLAIEELVFKFPRLSKSMLINAYAKVELEFKNELYLEIAKLAEHSNAEQTIKVIMKKYELIHDIASKYYYSWKAEYMAEKETVVTKTTTTIEKATPQELEKNAKKILEKAKEIQCEEKAPANKEEVAEMQKLLVLEEKVIKTIKVAGENGTYKADTNKGVELSNEGMIISFSNEKDFEQWVSEVKQVFKMVM